MYGVFMPEQINQGPHSEAETIVSQLKNGEGESILVTPELQDKMQAYIDAIDDITLDLVGGVLYDKTRDTRIARRGNSARGRVYITQYLLRRYNFITKKDNLYYYDKVKGIWRSDGQEKLQYSLRQLSIGLTKNTINEVISKIKDLKINNNVEFMPPVSGDYINLQNGVFNCSSFQLQLHDPDKHFIGVLPVIYDTNAKCTKVIGFITDIAAPSERAFTNIIEEMGYCLIEGNPFQKGFIHLGESGANGKSTLSEFIRKFLGEDNTTSLTVTQISEDRFLAQKLFGKLANIGAELTQKEVKDENRIKALLGEDTFTADIKFKQPFEFKNKSKMIMSANYLPWAHTDYAWNRRWQIIDFLNRFVGSKADREILQKITTQEELSGIFNLVIRVRNRLAITKRFSFEDTPEETERKYARGAGDSVKLFKLDCIRKKEGNLIEKDTLYRHYVSYCANNKLIPKEKAWFFRMLHKYNDLGFVDQWEGGYDNAWKASSSHGEYVISGIEVFEPVPPIVEPDFLSVTPANKQSDQQRYEEYIRNYIDGLMKDN
jgi:putative DNA primase/helicase